MKLRYKTKKLEKSLESDKGLSKNYNTLAKKIKQRIQQLKSADNLEVIRQVSVLRLHPHTGKNKGIWSIDIQKNWRILFTIGNNPIPLLKDGGIDIKKVTIIEIASVADPH